MSQVNELIIITSVTLDMILQFRGIQMKQIRKLQIYIEHRYCDYIMEELFHVFLYTQSLIVKLLIDSTRIMGRFIDGFTKLSNASFVHFSVRFAKTTFFIMHAFR